MKNFLKKLHIGSNLSEDSEGSTSSENGKRLSNVSPSEWVSQSKSENKPLSAISGWLNSVRNRNSPSPPLLSNEVRGEVMEPSDSMGSGSNLDALRCDLGSRNSRDSNVEEYQIQLALELSAREDPEAVQIEAVKRISLGSCPPENAPAEDLAYRYWNYNALSYDDKILDGFYDLYGILMESTSSRMPSLVDLQAKPVSDDISWEAILVNKEADIKLLNLEKKALEMAANLRSNSVNLVCSNMVQKLATLVSDHMGGPVGNRDTLLIAWKNLHYHLKATFGSMVFPLGSLTIGLARHRALLFKVLADSVDIPCRLVKGRRLTGSDDEAMNFVKTHDGREYIVDLMADPGTLIPSETARSYNDHEEYLLSTSALPKDAESSHVTSSSTRIISSFEDQSEFGTVEKRFKFKDNIAAGTESTDGGESSSSGIVGQQIKSQQGSEQFSDSSKRPWYVKKDPATQIPCRSNNPYLLARSSSWTEGVSSKAARRLKVNDVSEYMIDAAKENPRLAQKFNDVLLESGVVAPPNLFTEMYREQLDTPLVQANSLEEENGVRRIDDIQNSKVLNDLDQARFLPPLPHHSVSSRGRHSKQLGLVLKKVTENPVSSESEIASVNYTKTAPVVAAAAVSSSVAVATTNYYSDPKNHLPVPAAAGVAIAAAVSKQYETLETSAQSPYSYDVCFSPTEYVNSDADTHIAVFEQRGSRDRGDGALGVNSEGERISDRSTGNDSAKSDVTLDDIADCEILWEDITLGERIGLGSYGEVYRGELHGTDVAVKKLLDQDIAGESLEEFKSEVRLMKRLRHPNVVLFMGAVTRPPNLSIVAEFLPRGSLYRLIHRATNQLDMHRRLRMALDAARGMNYLHNCTPVIVHRDLKTPNLLVDKNWVVKVSDFGLSRIKHRTFLSSRSPDGTAEWMAPEVLRNEPSDEKCDVYSFGVVLWELCTLQQPWVRMNPMQVVGAVGFQHRRLDIPDDMDPAVADIIKKCWQTDPRSRPSFAEIMDALKSLQKPKTSSQVPRSSSLVRKPHEKG